MLLRWILRLTFICKIPSVLSTGRVSGASHGTQFVFIAMCLLLVAKLHLPFAPFPSSSSRGVPMRFPIVLFTAGLRTTFDLSLRQVSRAERNLRATVLLYFDMLYIRNGTTKLLDTVAAAAAALVEYLRCFTRVRSTLLLRSHLLFHLPGRLHSAALQWNCSVTNQQGLLLRVLINSPLPSRYLQFGNEYDHLLWFALWLKEIGK